MTGRPQRPSPPRQRRRLYHLRRSRGCAASAHAMRADQAAAPARHRWRRLFNLFFFHPGGGGGRLRPFFASAPHSCPRLRASPRSTEFLLLGFRSGLGVQRGHNDRSVCVILLASRGGISPVCVTAAAAIAAVAVVLCSSADFVRPASFSLRPQTLSMVSCEGAAAAAGAMATEATALSFASEAASGAPASFAASFAAAASAPLPSPHHLLFSSRLPPSEVTSPRRSPPRREAPPSSPPSPPSPPPSPPPRRCHYYVSWVFPHQLQLAAPPPPPPPVAVADSPPPLRRRHRRVRRASHMFHPRR